MDTKLLGQTARIDVRNVGGIEEASVEFEPGITVLTGRNATNRTSLLRSIMAVMGSDDASLKADADEGRVEFSVGDERYFRTFTRTNGSVTTGGEPFLDDPEFAELFAFLLESNEARRSVARGEDLRELIMRPVDTEAIRTEIRELEREKSRIDDDLDSLADLKGELPELERKRGRLEDDIETKRAELEDKEAEIEALDADIDKTRAEKQELESRLDDLREKRSELERVRSDIDLQQDSIESLTAERRELEAELDELPDAPMGEHGELDQEIERLRGRTGTLEREVSDLQDVIQFNEDQLAESGVVTEQLTKEDGAVTDTLVDETVVCWTCGTSVETDRIRTTLDQLREIRQEKLKTIRTLESELSQLKEERQTYREQQQRKETLDRKLDDVADELEDRETQLETLREKRSRLNVVTQETRFSLIQDILGHRSGLPTLKELDYVNPSRSQTTIRQHLQRLVDAGIVEKVELPEDRRQNDLPYTFYGTSEEGRRFLEEHKLLRAEETLRAIYNQVERTAEIERYETAPRPDR